MKKAPPRWGLSGTRCASRQRRRTPGAPIEGVERRDVESYLPMIRHQDRDVYYRQRWQGMGIGSYAHDPLPIMPDELEREGLVVRKVRDDAVGNHLYARPRQRVRGAVQIVAADLVRLYAARQLLHGHAFREDTPWQQELEAAFPYEETDDQLRAIREVKADMESPRPMDRLIPSFPMSGPRCPRLATPVPWSTCGFRPRNNSRS